MGSILRAARIREEDFVAFIVEAVAIVLLTHPLRGTVGPIALWVNG